MPIIVFYFFGLNTGKLIDYFFNVLNNSRWQVTPVATINSNIVIHNLLTRYIDNSIVIHKVDIEMILFWMDIAWYRR